MSYLVRGNFILHAVPYLVPLLAWFEVRIVGKNSKKTENLEGAN